MTAVIIGVWSMIFLGGLMRGIANQLVENGIATLTGHIQVHRQGYRDDPVIENSMGEPFEVERALKKVLPSGSRWAKRIRVSAVASNARHASGVILVGIEPANEAKVSFIGKAIFEGRYLEPEDDHGIVVGKALAKRFETGLGRKLVLMSQDTGKEISSRAFRIVGIFRADMEATEKGFVFVTLPAAEQMLKLENGISEVSVLLPDHEGSELAASALRFFNDTATTEIYTWRELLSLTVAILKMYDWSIFLWFIVVFIAMAFGIVNTTLMAVFERIREFGLQKALGMKSQWIIGEVLMECSLLLIMGMVAGNVLGYLSVWALSRSGLDLSSLSAGIEFVGLPRVIYPAIIAKDVITANLVVLILGLVVSLYPAFKAARFSPVEAMAHT
jgi:ABC-type lipoprotein release transport system permease subunit